MLIVIESVTNQPINYLLQLYEPSGATRKEDYGTRLLMLLFTRQNASKSSKPCLP